MSENKASWHDVENAYDKLIEQATDEMLEAEPDEVLGCRKIVKWLKSKREDFSGRVFHRYSWDDD